MRGQILSEAIAQHHRRARDGKHDPLELRRLVNAFVSVCNAIAYAHSRSVIHRDLKPENVVLGEFGEVIVLDWGLAKLLNTDEDGSGVGDNSEDGAEDENKVYLSDSVSLKRTVAGQILGTPAYMAPEQAAGQIRRMDYRTDVYGLGAMLFEIFTGRPPHAGDDARSVVDRIVTGETPRARSVDPTVPRSIDAVCARAMARSMSDRYHRAQDLAADVERWLADEPVSVYRPPWRQRLGRWARRHRTLSVVSLVVAITTALLIANLWWQRSSFIYQELDILAKETQQGTGGLQVLLEILRQDTRYLGSQEPIQELFEARAQNDPQAEAEARGELAGIFTEFLQHRTNYFQARLIGADGKEIVRVERQPIGNNQRAVDTPVNVPDNELQEKGTRDYFRNALQLAQDEVYLSRVGLNREQGVVQAPRVPVIRASVPVFLDRLEGTPEAVAGPEGVVVINIDFRPLFALLESGATGPSRDRFVYVTDHEGHFLLNPDEPERTFGFEFDGGEEYKIQSRFPDLAPFFTQENIAREGTVVSGRRNEKRAIYLLKLNYDTKSPNRYLWLAVAAPYKQIVALANQDYAFIRNLTVVLILVLFALPIVVSQLRPQRMEARRFRLRR